MVLARYGRHGGATWQLGDNRLLFSNSANAATSSLPLRTATLHPHPDIGIALGSKSLTVTGPTIFKMINPGHKARQTRRLPLLQFGFHP